MRTKLLLFLLLSLSLLSGCTHVSDRIYTVCKRTETDTYCYKDEDNFYLISDEGKLLKISGVGLDAKPALCLIAHDGEFNFENILPGLYSGTLESVSAYVSLLEENGYSATILYSDCDLLEIVLAGDNSKVRVIYNIHGEVRMYAVDDSDNSIELPYINEK